MNEYQHHILTRGKFQIVALTRDGESDTDEIYGYAVLSSSGVKLRQELTLSDAQIWLDDRIVQELLASGAASPDMMSPSRPAELSGLRVGRKRR
ncbi:hypothetical protein [Pseudomonas sp. CGJS7]|uniref:hypothetical protein n=1 Tax=Pseudomonas sp. CGJS7 TaxID=3109348 RepID=UPI00300B7FAE